MLAPWLTRNYLASHNPVFPFAASIFGNGPWTADQVARYAAAHTFHGSVLERFRLLVRPDATPAPNGQSSHRGMLHPQWGLFFPLTLIAMGSLLIPRRPSAPASKQSPIPPRLTGSTPPPSLCAFGLIAQVALWLFTGHLQSSRGFLLPLIAPGAAICGLAAARFGRGPILITLLSLPILAQAVFYTVIFAEQRANNPNSLLIPGPGLRTGQIVSATCPRRGSAKIARTAPPPNSSSTSPSPPPQPSTSWATPHPSTSPATPSTTPPTTLGSSLLPTTLPSGPPTSAPATSTTSWSTSAKFLGPPRNASRLDAPRHHRRRRQGLAHQAHRARPRLGHTGCIPCAAHRASQAALTRPAGTLL